MPEDLPTENSIKKIESEKKKSIKPKNEQKN